MHGTPLSMMTLNRRVQRKNHDTQTTQSAASIDLLGYFLRIGHLRKVREFVTGPGATYLEQRSGHSET
jgi:hypothetical protein